MLLETEHRSEDDICYQDSHEYGNAKYMIIKYPIFLP